MVPDTTTQPADNISETAPEEHGDASNSDKEESTAPVIPALARFTPAPRPNPEKEPGAAIHDENDIGIGNQPDDDYSVAPIGNNQGLSFGDENRSITSDAYKIRSDEPEPSVSGEIEDDEVSAGFPGNATVELEDGFLEQWMRSRLEMLSRLG